MTPPRARLDLSWRRRETAAAVALAVLASAALGARAMAREPWPGCSPRQHRLRVARATETIDPNTASLGSLMRLPDVGPQRAKAIDDYRRRPGAQPFRRLEDLKNVPGFGEGVVRDIARAEAFLRFPAAASQP